MKILLIAVTALTMLNIGSAMASPNEAPHHETKVFVETASVHHERMQDILTPAKDMSATETPDTANAEAATSVRRCSGNALLCHEMLLTGH